MCTYMLGIASIHDCYYLIIVFIAECVAITTVDLPGDIVASKHGLTSASVVY